MTKYYVPANNALGRDEVTEAEYLSLVGGEAARPYVRSVYRGELAIEDVPSELQAEVQSCVDARVARHGEYGQQEVSAEELMTMIGEVL